MNDEFYERFPSLWCRGCYLEDGKMYTTDNHAKYFDIETIRNHCLDKEKVKEAIKVHIKKMRNAYSDLMRVNWESVVGPEGCVARESINLCCDLMDDLGLNQQEVENAKGNM